ncbi:MAG: hypothetical protein KA236_12000 [Verrucomicrobia bacterium]|jgi:hypothetical protein|nr:hypothetical protein [Verrucomicrobiota bacterium]
MQIGFYLVAVVLLAPVIGVRLVFLYRGPWGWINYLANVFSEFFVKKIRWSRLAVESVMALAGLLALYFAGAEPLSVAVVLAILLGLELYVTKLERHLLATTYTPLDSIGLRQANGRTTRGLAAGYPTPSTHPKLTLNLIGPFTARMPRYELGALLVGRQFRLRLLIGNHTIVPTQTGLRLTLQVPPAWCCGQNQITMLPRLESGEVHEVDLDFQVKTASGPGSLQLLVEWGHFRENLTVHYANCRTGGTATIQRAVIQRYPGACQSAFAWRGDMDLYDESTLQSIEGLEVTLSLAARYRIPQTLYLSSRLSLDEAAARQWGEHYGADRGAARIPTFIRWMQDHVELRHACVYPFRSNKRFLLELGNHGHLHYGTDTAGALENGWKPKARMGAGVYPWLTADHSSFAEQRDNALEARRLFEQYFHFTPRSWAMPNRTNDRFTAAAMEAAGCEVLSDSNVRTRHNVLLQPPPHHPPTTAAVELTKRYPGDPQHLYHVAMNLFWIHRAHRRRIPVVFMCHQHLRQFDGYACTRFTEYTLRHALEQFHGDLHINTVFGIGKYWREVLSPQTGRVRVATTPDGLRVTNASDLDLKQVPVDVELSDGRRFTLLMDLPAGDELAWKLET